MSSHRRRICSKKDDLEWAWEDATMNQLGYLLTEEGKNGRLIFKQENGNMVRRKNVRKFLGHVGYIYV